MQHSTYELEFSAFLGQDVKAYAFWKGRVAFYAILKALGIGPGDEVILPAFTCVVVPNAIRMAGGRPVYVDITTGSFNLDPRQVERMISPRTKIILLQHTFGIPAPTAEVLDLADRYQLHLVEDCAHALGSFNNGQHVGLSGKAAFFSSQWSKPVITGLGGVAVTRDEGLARRLAEIKTQFQLPPLGVRGKLLVQYLLYASFFRPQLFWLSQALIRVLSRLGLFVGSSSSAELNGDLPHDHEWVMPAYQHRIGQKQIGAVQSSIARRKALTKLYESRLAAAGWQIAPNQSEITLVRYPVKVANKEELLGSASNRGIELGSWFETPLHPVPLDRHAAFQFEVGRYPQAELAARQTINFPLHARVSDGYARKVVEYVIQYGRPANGDLSHL